MAGHHTFLAWPEGEFEAFVDRLDNAFLHQHAALYYDSDTQAHMIDVFAPAQAGFSPREWRELGALMFYLDDFLVYAFESAPERVIRQWGEEHEEGLGERAVACVAYIRDNASAMRSSWRTRARSSIPVFGDIDVDVVFSPRSSGLQALLRMDSFVCGGPPRRNPIASSRSWFTAALTINELDRLIDQLTDARDLLLPLAVDDESDDSEVGDGDKS